MRTAIAFTAFALSVAATCGVAGTADERLDPLLQRTIEECATGFRGDVGVYVRHLPSGRSASARSSSA